MSPSPRSAPRKETASLAFGPVASRRFGSSLGVNTVPLKVCDYSCVYCQLGPTSRLTVERSCFFDASSIVLALEARLHSCQRPPDFVTIIGEGEPTLASNLKDVVGGCRSVWRGRLALVTNGSLLSSPAVISSLSGVDVVSPTVSAGDPSTFRRVHRPHPEIGFKGVAEGLRRLRDVYDGEIWPEVMLVKGFNDSDESLEAIATLLLEVRPDKVFVTVPTRPPALDGVEPAERAAVDKALETIQGAVDMTGPEATSFASSSEDPALHLLSIARFHPLREEQALLLLGGGEGARARLTDLVQSGELRVLEYRGTRHYLRGR